MELSTTSITKGRRYVYDGSRVVEERMLEAIDAGTTTLEVSASKLERIYVTGPSIDEWLYAAIDFNSDGDIGDDLNSTECSWSGGVAGKDTADAAFYYLTNRMGSVAALLDKNSDRKILEYNRYRSYGEVTVLTVLDDGTSPGTASDGIEDTPSDLGDNPTRRISKFANPLTFTGRRLDDATGVMYYRHRMYDPVSGRFVGRDPLGYVDGMNQYWSFKNNPKSVGDPLGLFATIDSSDDRISGSPGPSAGYCGNYWWAIDWVVGGVPAGEKFAIVQEMKFETKWDDCTGSNHVEKASYSECWDGDENGNVAPTSTNRNAHGETITSHDIWTGKQMDQTRGTTTKSGVAFILRGYSCRELGYSQKGRDQPGTDQQYAGKLLAAKNTPYFALLVIASEGAGVHERSLTVTWNCCESRCLSVLGDENRESTVLDGFGAGQQ